LKHSGGDCEETPLGRCRISTGIRGARSTKPTECCVIIDVLRASSTIATALAHGVKEIRTFTSIPDALKLKKKRYTVAGERKGVTLAGFDLGNSPLEFLRATGKRPIKKMVLTTSNLTRVLAHCESAFICSSINLTAVSRQIKRAPANIVVVGGPHGVVEDLGIALALLMKVQGLNLQKGLVQKMITQSRAADYLTSIGYGEDVKFIASLDRYNVVPLYRKGKIKIQDA
jgi:2-phosphosulfolactate phosphatase